MEHSLHRRESHEYTLMYEVPIHELAQEGELERGEGAPEENLKFVDLSV
jgi:hypothetical protein